MPSAMYRPVIPVTPPILRMMGISAVVVAVLSALVSLLAAGFAASLYLTSKAARDRIVQNAPLVMPVSTPRQRARFRVRVRPQIGRRGLDESQRSQVISAFEPLVQMGPQQSGQLDALLAEDGGEIFGAAGDQAVPADEVRRQIADHIGPLASNSADSNPFYFETPAGRAEIYSDRALFYRRNSPVIVRASAGRRLNAGGHPVLQPADVETLVGAARQSADGALDASQERTLRDLLSDPQQKLVSLGADQSLGIDGASVRPDGYALISFPGGPILLDPKGNIILRTGGNAIPVVSPAACAAVLIEGLLSIGLAVFLLITGVRLMRSPRPPPRSVRVYAILKTIVGVTGGAAAGWMTASYLALPALTRGTPSLNAAAYGSSVGAAFAVVGCAFPVALLLASRSRQIRGICDV